MTTENPLSIEDEFKELFSFTLCDHEVRVKQAMKHIQDKFDSLVDKAAHFEMEAEQLAGRNKLLSKAIDGVLAAFDEIKWTDEVCRKIHFLRDVR